MTSSIKEMLAAANASVPRISPGEATSLITGQAALLLDVRDAPELSASGKLRNAVNVSRGMLEFKADGDSPDHDGQFQPDRPVVVYCASGGRSALAGRTLQGLGYGKVYNLGSFKDAIEAGFPSEPA